MHGRMKIILMCHEVIVHIVIPRFCHEDEYFCTKYTGYLETRHAAIIYSRDKTLIILQRVIFVFFSSTYKVRAVKYVFIMNLFFFANISCEQI